MNLKRLIFQIRKEKFDLVINLQRFASSGLLTGFSRSKRKIGFNKNPLSFMFTRSFPHEINGSLHEIDRNHALITDLTDSRVSKPKLYPSERDKQFVKSIISGKYVTMAPASVWYTKALPVEKWTELIAQIPSDYEIFLLGSKQDRSLCEELIIQSTQRKIKNLAGELSLLQSAALMSEAVMNYSNDSAPMHLASAVNAPITAIFCSTIEGFGFGPLSEKSFVLQTAQDLDCRPCGLHGKTACPEGHFNCALQIKMVHHE